MEFANAIDMWCPVKTQLSLKENKSKVFLIRLLSLNINNNNTLIIMKKLSFFYRFPSRSWDLEAITRESLEML